MDWLTQFPQMDDNRLRDIKKMIDEAFRGFTRAYGDGIETLFEPLRIFMVQAERFMTGTPWIIVFALIIGIAWAGSRSGEVVAATAVTMLLIGYFGMWEDTMKTISMIFVCTVISIAIGIPLGIAMARWNRMQAIVRAISNQYFTLGVFNGFAIVGIAIIFDRVSQSFGKRLQKHSEVIHG